MMIEHIESYLKQHHCRDYFNSYGETVEDDHYFMYREEVDGLIELIVRECANWIDGSPSTDAGQLVLTKSFIIDNIKEHFGVEE
jgi:hypothetical protein